MSNVYIAPDALYGPKDQNELFRKRPKYIIIGEFNAHNSLWGCLSTNVRGRHLEETTRHQNYVISNTNAQAHINWVPTHHSRIQSQQKWADKWKESPYSTIFIQRQMSVGIYETRQIFQLRSEYNNLNTGLLQIKQRWWWPVWLVQKSETIIHF
jgi:Endonuclease-reverse transcriptase